MSDEWVHRLVENQPVVSIETMKAWKERALKAEAENAALKAESAKLARDYETTREAHDEAYHRLGVVEADCAALQNMVRDLCIDHSDKCVCRFCEKVFRIDAAKEKPAIAYRRKP